MQAMQEMIMMMQSIDDTCVQLTTAIDKRELHCISFIGDHPAANMSDISELLDVPMSTTTGVIQKLVDKSMVSRSPSPFDRRSVQLHLTEAGQKVFQTFNEMKVKMTNRIAEDLQPDEFDLLVELLEKITAKLKARLEVS